MFPRFEFNVCGHFMTSGPGYICWSDLQRVQNKNKLLQANVRNTPKLSYNALYPNNNKQNVDLALTIFHDTTIDCCILELFIRETRGVQLSSVNLVLVECCECRDSYSHSPLSQGITTDDGKIQFHFQLADWF